MSPEAAALIAGAASFPLCLAYDLLGMRGKRGGILFALGGLLLAASTGYILFLFFPAAVEDSPYISAAAGLCAALSLAGLIKALFFALPKGTYTKAGKKAAVTSGLYALCRHPGVLMLALFYFFLALAVRCSAMWAMFALYTLLDGLYAAVQDIYIFPKTLENYGAYKHSTPFLLPTCASLRAMRRK